ncbi:C2H2 finger domain-containing protein [Penicillium hispanicum]|uniref:C2H2 finger domain-containing protein n=1 Tax=Penicillium hispanicum TaxID=1080232 RepID=UPI00254169D9|nr:C2H2 finger domain-containing protein [Penicillium hispanicum]KAJ5570316.1 C2H2 finger domain-containing protein [Penicillium hispanicum]
MIVIVLHPPSELFQPSSFLTILPILLSPLFCLTLIMSFLFGGYVQVVDDQYWCRLCARWFTLYDGVYNHCQTTSQHEWCELCERVFESEKAFRQHCQSTTQHEWCGDCERVFATEDALEQHYKSSSCHHVCLECEDRPEFAYEYDLEEHYENEHGYCYDCEVFYHSKESLDAHNVLEHFGCKVCLRTFNSDQARTSHMKAHDPREFKCPYCVRDFSRFSHFLLHLENGACGSANRILKLGLEVSNSNNFHDHSCDDWPWYCEQCDQVFEFLSGLFSHVEDRQPCTTLLQPGNSLAVLKTYMKGTL